MGFLRRWRRTGGNDFFCNVYSRLSVVPIIEDSDYSASDNDISSESQINDSRVTCREFKNIHLSSAVVRLQKSLSWKVAREFCFPSNLEKYGFDQSFSAFKMFLHVYVCAEMQMEVYALLREIVCYYQKAGLNLYKLSYALLDNGRSVEISSYVINVLIKVFASNKLLNNAIEAFIMARKFDLKLSHLSCNFLLKCLSEADEREHLATIFEDMRNYGPVPNVYTYTIMLKVYCSIPHVDIEEAYNIIKEMEEVGISPSVVTCSTFILGLCSVGEVEFAWKYIQGLKREGQTLNLYCYNTVIHGFVNRGEVHKAIEVFFELKSSGIEANLYSYNTLIEGLCARGEMESANILKEEMLNINLAPNYVTYKSLILGFCKAGRFEKALKLFDSLREDVVLRDCYLWNHMIYACCNEGRVVEALRYIDEMRELEISPNVYSYSPIIDRLCKEQKCDRAFELIPRMLKDNQFPNVVIYGSLLDGYANQANMRKLRKGYGKVENTRKSLDFCSEMLKIGINPDVVIYTILINVLCSWGSVEEAYQLLTEMESRGLKPDVICYTSLIAGLCRSKDTWEALKVFNKMKKDILPNEVTYTCLIGGSCMIRGMDSMADKVIDEMRRRNVDPDRVTYDVLIRWCRRLGYEERVWQLKDEIMRQSGIVANNDLIGCFTEFGTIMNPWKLLSLLVKSLR